MALPTTFKIDVLSDKDYNKGLYQLIGTAHTYEDLKIMVNNNIKGQKTALDGPFNDLKPHNAALSVRVHTGEGVSNFDFKQNDDNTFTLVLYSWATKFMAEELEAFLNDN